MRRKQAGTFASLRVLAALAAWWVPCACTPRQPAPVATLPSPSTASLSSAPAPLAAAGADALAELVVARIAALQPADVVPGEPPRATPSMAEAWLALAALQLEKAGDYLVEVPPDEAEAEACRQHARELLNAQDPSQPPQLVRRERFLEHAYFARNDGSPQPYYVYVPGSYDAARPTPLVLCLHGWLPDTSRIRPWLMSDPLLDEAEKHGVLLAMPHGRTNTDFQYAGEVDVIRVLREMERFYRVDPDRVYLAGVSMGGAGAWQIGVHYPHLFAGLAPISAQTDWFRFWHRAFAYPTRDELPRHIERLMAMHNSLDLAGNLGSLYSYSRQATTCFLGIDHGRDMHRRLSDLKAPHVFAEDPSPLGHHIYLLPSCWQACFDHLLPHRRSRPREVRYVTYSLRFPRAYWVEILQFASWRQPAAVEARITNDGHVSIVTTNVAALALDPPVEWASADGSFRIEWNGRLRPPERPDLSGRLTLRDPDHTPPEGTHGAKSRAVCGPASDVFNFPFVAVRGTVGTPDENAASERLANLFVEDWQAYAEGRAPLVRDTDVTPQMMKAKGLILFGLPECNAVIQRIAAGLPFGLSRQGISLPDGRAYGWTDTGIALTYPNPLAPDHYVLVFHGVPWGAGRANNHKFDFLPDFTIFTPDLAPGLNINRYRAAGFFDEYWRYAPALTDYGPGS